jgi:hypothetical protein
MNKRLEQVLVGCSMGLVALLFGGALYMADVEDVLEPVKVPLRQFYVDNIAWRTLIIK